MSSWHRLLFFLLLFKVCANKIIHKDSSEALDDFLESSREDVHNRDYSYELDEHELEPAIKKHPVYKPYMVCKANDFCECAEKRIDCSAKTRKRLAGKSKVTPLKTPAIVTRSEFIPKYVYLSGNEIELVNQYNLLSAGLIDVEGVDLSHNEIEVIDDNAFDHLRRLRKLKLNNNYITLDVANNWLTDKLENLELLNLAYNDIKAINNGTFDPLQDLVTLILDGNYGLLLTRNTFTKGKTTSLTNLSLNGCKLRTLPDKLFENLPNLKFLSLIDNQFTSIPATLKLAPNLQILDLSKNNDITSWPSYALKGSSIVKLFLRDMQGIKAYGNCAFCNLLNLELIDLSGSKNLAFVDGNAFGLIEDADLLKSLKIGRMEDCKLTTLSENLLPWEQLEEVAVGGNPLNCNKDLLWMFQKKIAFVGQKAPKCATPAGWKGKLPQKVPGEVESLSSVTTFFRTLFFMGIFIGLICIVIISLIYLNRFHESTAFTFLFNRHRLNNSGFSNLSADVNEDSEHVLEDDDNEFVPRPAAV